MFFAIQSWDKSINFSKTVVDEASGKEKQFKNFFANVEVYLRQPVWISFVSHHINVAWG